MYNYLLAGFIFTMSFSALSLSLTAEQQRALTHFNEETSKAAIDFLPPLKSIGELNDFRNGKFGLGSIVTDDLPKAIYWYWNKSCGEIKLTNEKFWQITFFKLNSRLKNAFKPQYSSAPKHKLWVFNIKSSEYNDFNFLWLEQYGEGDQDQKYDFSFLNDPIIDDRYKDLPLWLNDSLENLLE